MSADRLLAALIAEAARADGGAIRFDGAESAR
jgi:hypothetical protein